MVYFCSDGIVSCKLLSIEMLKTKYVLKTKYFLYTISCIRTRDTYLIAALKLWLISFRKKNYILQLVHSFNHGLEKKEQCKQSVKCHIEEILLYLSDVFET